MLGTLGAFESILLGQLGSRIVTDTSAQTGDFAVIVPLTDTVISFTSSNFADGTAIVKEGNAGASALLTVKAGVPLCGRFSAFSLTSGSVIAYNI